MYKDKDKQREAVKLATRRYRSKGITEIPVTFKGVIPATVIPKQSHNPMMVGYVPPRTA